MLLDAILFFFFYIFEIMLGFAVKLQNLFSNHAELNYLI